MGVLRSLAAATVPCERVVLTNYATADIRRQCLALLCDFSHAAAAGGFRPYERRRRFAPE
jgi:hypothetical protein